MFELPSVYITAMVGVHSKRRQTARAFNALVNITIAPAGNKASELNWDANVNISGPLGSLAKPLVEGNIKKIVTQLFDCVKAKLS